MLSEKIGIINENSKTPTKETELLKDGKPLKSNICKLSLRSKEEPT